MMSSDERLGTIVGGKYRIAKFLAAGGMGAVYEAHHVVVKRRFAVKFLRADLALRRDVLLRFQREAEAAGALESENIAAAVDFGIAPDGAPYIVMEYLAGLDLARVLAVVGPMLADRAADLVLQACSGIHAAHAAGVIHRDLKPENLFVCRRSDGSDLVKILDFGVAKLQASDAGNAVTRTGGMLGTPSYMSPEQARGGATIDQRSDVYSLGVILYELLTGRVPHPGDSYNAVIYHISTQPALPLTREGQEFPRGLVDIVNRALSLEPGDRYESADAMAQALAAFARRSVWPKVEESEPLLAVAAPPLEPVTGEPAGSSPGSVRDAAELERKPVGFRTPAFIATGLALALAAFLSVKGTPPRNPEPSGGAISTVQGPAATPVGSQERTAIPALTALPASEQPTPAQAATSTTRSGRPLVARGRPEVRPATSAAPEPRPAVARSIAVSNGEATFDPRNPYE